MVNSVDCRQSHAELNTINNVMLGAISKWNFSKRCNGSRCAIIRKASACFCNAWRSNYIVLPTGGPTGGGNDNGKRSKPIVRKSS
ncbi:hypothetical protein WN55_00342 [Dufourea novaeangliae]|uniref:Uncharacterized protein n=1 Tax=Dufourea novaeangliae TaxID=178035 RepID=A0A154PHD4_DUFNO|nr:hypothetical protein WN55_00342 [Dufourea novaeangliae]